MVVLVISVVVGTSIAATYNQMEFGFEVMARSVAVIAAVMMSDECNNNNNSR